MISTYT